MAEKIDAAGDEREAGTSKPKSKFKVLCSAALALGRNSNKQAQTQNWR
jgi:hypothetical protein